MYRIGRVYASRETMRKPIVALVFLLILLSSLITEAIGIHALFGAFMAGVVMPENLNFKRVFTEKIEDVSLVILLPLFFVSTGLTYRNRTDQFCPSVDGMSHDHP